MRFFPTFESSKLLSDNPFSMGRSGLFVGDAGEDPDDSGQSGAGGHGGEEADGDKTPSLRFANQAEAERAYGELRSSHDRSAELQRQTQSSMEIELQGYRDAANTQRDESGPTEEQLRVKGATDRLMEGIRKVDKDDPAYSRNYLESLVGTMMQEIGPKAEDTQEIVRRVLNEDRNEQINTQSANDRAIDEMKQYGLPETALPFLVARRNDWDQSDPSWKSRVPMADQIPLLVQSVAKDMEVSRTERNESEQHEQNLHSKDEGQNERMSMRDVVRQEQRKRANGMQGGGSPPQQGDPQSKGSGELGSLTSDLKDFRKSRKDAAAKIYSRI